MAETSRTTERTGEGPGFEEPTAPTTAQDRGSTGPRRLDRIAARAYELYQRRGGEQGQELEDWLEAERQIDNADEEAGGTR